VALYCLSSDSQHNPRPRIVAGHSILTSLYVSGKWECGREAAEVQWLSELLSVGESIQGVCFHENLSPFIEKLATQ